MERQARERIKNNKVMPGGGPEFDKNKTRKLILDGNYKEAKGIVDKAENKASTPQLKAKILADYADQLSQLSRIKKDKNLEIQAVNLYKTALGSLEGANKLKSANNYGALLMRMNNEQEALKVLQSVEPSYNQQNDPEMRAPFLYNLGRAYENNGNFINATETYQKAATVDPVFSPASRAVNRLLPNAGSELKSIEATAKWLNAIVDGGDFSLAQKSLQAVLSQKDLFSSEDYELIFIPIIRYLTLAEVGPDQFFTWSEKLPPTDLLHEKASTVKNELIQSYDANYQISFKPGSGLQYVMTIAEVAKDANDPVDLSKFLKMIGDSYQSLHKPELALQRYAAAWSIDTTNMEAAYLAALILYESGNRFQDNRFYLDDLIFQVFEQEGGAYKAHVGEDWVSILRFHVVLGTIYSEKGDWGNSNNPQSAIFQFEHAIKAYTRLKAQKKIEEAGPIAGVKAALARSFDKSGQMKKAGSMYIDAVKSALEEKDGAFVLEIITNVESNTLRYRLTNEDKKQIDSLKESARLL